MGAFDPSRLVNIPLQHQDQLIALRGYDSCWLFARQNYTPSIWLLLKREGFSGDLVSTSEELSDFKAEMGVPAMNRVLNFYHNTEGKNRSWWRIRDEFEDLILSQNLQVYRVEQEIEFRLINVADRLYATDDTRDIVSHDVVAKQRHQLTLELGDQIRYRWREKIAADNAHFSLSTLNREWLELQQASAVVTDAAWGALTGLWDAAVFVVEFVQDAAGKAIVGVTTALKGIGEFHKKMGSLVLEALQGNDQALLSKIESLGIQIHHTATNMAQAAQKIASAVVAKLKEGERLLKLLFNDSESRELIFDYIDSIRQSIKYTDSRLMGLKVVSTLVFEIGIDVLIGLATCGAGVVAKRVGQVASKASSVAKMRYGPFSAKAMDMLSDLARMMDSNLSNKGPRSQSALDVPPEANKTSASSSGKTTAQQKQDNSPNDTQIDDTGTNQSGQTCSKDDLTPCSADPISLVTGEEIFNVTDFTINGVASVPWVRKYKSSNNVNAGMGVGWTNPFSEKLVPNELGIAYHNNEARVIPFGRISVGGQTTNRAEQLTLIRNNEHRYTLIANGGTLVKQFELLTGEYYLPTSVRDGIGNGVDLVYDRHLNLKGAVSDYGARWTLDYQNQLVSQVQWHGINGEQQTLVRYYYNDDNDLIQAEDGNGNSEFYQYQNHVLVRRTIKSGYSFHFKWTEHSPRARCLRAWGDKINGNATYDYTFEWDIANKSVTAKDTRGGVEYFKFNDAGLPLVKRDQEGGETHYHYNVFNQLTQVVDPSGGIQRFAYDANQKLIQTTGIDGQVTRYRRDSLGNIIETQDSQGHRWHRTYTDHGLVKTQSNPLNETYHYDYNALGLPRSITNPLGESWHYIWDNLGQLTAVRDPQGQHTRYRRNGLGRVEAITYADGSRTQYEYDPQGNCTAINFPDGTSQRFLYNPLGLLAEQQDQDGRTTRYEYNGLSQVVKRTDTAGHCLHYEYDGERNLVGLINENGDRYCLKYDLNERLIEEIGFDGRTQRYQYNACGHLTVSEEIDPETKQCVNRIAYRRNGLGQLTEQWLERYNGKPHRQKLKQFDYDYAGRLVQADNPDRQLRWVYDAVGRVTEAHQDNQIIRHQYDTLGRRNGSLLPDGNKIDYQFDQLGRLSQVDLNHQLLTRITRDELGRETQRQCSNQIVAEREYDPQGRLQAQRFGKTSHAHTINQRSYQYNDAGQLSQIDDARRGTTQYYYDAIDRLVQVTGPQPETFVHDPAGNLLGASTNNVDETQQDRTRQNQITHNRLNFYGDCHYQYDCRGNRVKQKRGKGGKLVTHYQYDGLNQLVAVKTDNANVSYQYDALGRRIAKITETSDQKHVMQFWWNDDQLLSEHAHTDSNDRASTKTYLYEPNGFQPLAFIENDETYHYHLDHLGTPQEITNAQGDLVWSATYQAYGNLALADIEQVENNLRFQGQYFDEETGLHYNRFRYYDPEVGRFTQQDPIGLLGGTNNYQYVPNPVTWVDPFGLSCKEYQFDMVNNPGPLAEMRGTPAANFAGGKYSSRVLEEDTIFYRGGNGGGGKNSLGQWFNTSAPESVAKVRIDNAVKPQWINVNSLELEATSPVNAVYGIKIPKGTTVYEGPVGYQGGPYLGGQEVMQTFIPTPWAIDGVEVVSEAPLL